MAKAVTYFLWTWLFIIPLSYNYMALDPALYHKFLLLDISLIAAALLFYNRQRIAPISKPAVIFAGLYFIYFILSAVSLVRLDINGADGWLMWLNIASPPVFVLLLFQVNSISAIKPRQVAGVISWFAVVAAAAGLFQYINEVTIHGWSFIASEQVSVAFGHKNVFAELLLISLPFSIYAGLGNRLHYVLVAIVLLVLVILLCRAAGAGFVAGTLACGVMYTASRKQNRLQLYFLLAGGVVTVLLVMLLLGYATQAGGQVVHFFEKRNSFSEREQLWHATWQMIQLRPLFGSGLASWKIENMQYGLLGARNYTTFFQRPHNDVLWILSEQGLPALLAVLAAWLYTGYVLVRRILAEPDNHFLYCLLFALTGYAVYCNFGFPREREEHGVIMAFVAFFIFCGGKDAAIMPGTRLRTVLPVLLLLPVIAGTWWSGNRVIAEAGLYNFFEARQNNLAEEELKYLDKINPVYCTLDAASTPIAWHKGMLMFAQNNLAAAGKCFDEAVKVNPYHAYSLANKGTCLHLSGNDAGAEKYFGLSLHYAPGFPEAALNMAALKFNNHQVDSAAWYVGMANDTLSNPRYRQFLKVVMNACLSPSADSALGHGDSLLTNNYRHILTDSTGMMRLCKAAYRNNVTIVKQANKEIMSAAIINNPAIADTYK